MSETKPENLKAEIKKLDAAISDEKLRLKVSGAAIVIVFILLFIVTLYFINDRTSYPPRPSDTSKVDVQTHELIRYYDSRQNDSQLTDKLFNTLYLIILFGILTVGLGGHSLENKKLKLEILRLREKLEPEQK